MKGYHLVLNIKVKLSIYLFMVGWGCCDWRLREHSAVDRVPGLIPGAVFGARAANFSWLGRQGLASAHPGLVQGVPGVLLGDVSGARGTNSGRLGSQGLVSAGPGGV